MARFQGCQAAFLSHQHSVFEVLFLRAFPESLSLDFFVRFPPFGGVLLSYCLAFTRCF